METTGLTPTQEETLETTIQEEVLPIVKQVMEKPNGPINISSGNYTISVWAFANHHYPDMEPQCQGIAYITEKPHRCARLEFGEESGKPYLKH